VSAWPRMRSRGSDPPDERNADVGVDRHEEGARRVGAAWCSCWGRRHGQLISAVRAKRGCLFVIPSCARGIGRHCPSQVGRAIVAAQPGVAVTSAACQTRLWFWVRPRIGWQGVELVDRTPGKSGSSSEALRRRAGAFAPVVGGAGSRRSPQALMRRSRSCARNEATAVRAVLR
jgi:hypothetical protein